MRTFLLPKVLWLGVQPAQLEEFRYAKVGSQSRANNDETSSASRLSLFPVRFWTINRRLVHDPTEASIPTADCAEYFGSALNRYVPMPSFTMRSLVKLGDDVIDLNRRFLDGADWRPQTSSVERLRPFKLAQEMAAGTPYQETAFYKLLTLKMKASGYKLKINRFYIENEETLRHYCEYMLWLIHSVRVNGLRPRAEATDLLEPSFGSVRTTDEEEIEGEIRVAVNEHGEFIHLYNGRHRLSVAHGLGMKVIPATVGLVHARWVMALTYRLGLPPHAALRTWLQQFQASGGSAMPNVAPHAIRFARREKLKALPPDERLQQNRVRRAQLADSRARLEAHRAATETRRAEIEARRAEREARGRSKPTPAEVEAARAERKARKRSKPTCAEQGSSDPGATRSTHENEQ